MQEGYDELNMTTLSHEVVGSTLKPNLLCHFTGLDFSGTVEAVHTFRLNRQNQIV
jgi:hypothetical protein